MLSNSLAISRTSSWSLGHGHCEGTGASGHVTRAQERRRGIGCLLLNVAVVNLGAPGQVGAPRYRKWGFGYEPMMGGIRPVSYTDIPGLRRFPSAADSQDMLVGLLAE